ncbi:WD40/YVTN/BNR-like repeat-containing protein [Zhouia amylolytica]|uniref:WD40/YVTN/BNR-like repeat-containing protein n=1 Tax=Zhouia amylolytica TaxID=376730 RepID=UPI0020CB8C35|nr:hypothetical protein [Zhouia amylolytica]MCQ0111292.1 hypothetical protein [Zhouia amylolytica]
MKKFLLFLSMIFSISLVSQEFSMDLVKNMKPRNIGPGGMSGRVTAIDVVHKNPDVMYVGTASGGLWKSTSGGIKWSPIFDNQITASIGAVEIQQSNPSVIWVGTGEGNPRNSLNGGFGIYKSLDGGKTWKGMGLENTRHIHRIVVDPTNPDIVYAGAIGSPWGKHEERGVFKTTDGGKTWNKILYTNESSGVADMVMDPNNPNKLFVAMWEHKRDPWFFKSGGTGSGLFMTHDGGENWKKISDEDGFPEGELGRIGIAIAQNKPNIVYALVESKKNALYKSLDGGFKWEKINDKEDIGNRPFYYSEIYVDPQNENRIYSVFTYINVSEDGGKNFSQLMPAYGSDHGIHPDHHAWWIHPDDGSFMIDGNDGGMSITRDGGKTWRFIGNLPVAQFYHISVDNEFPYNVYGGMQDNGSWRGPAYVWKAQGIRNSYWQEIAFGDGFDVVPDKDDSRFGFAMSQQGYVQRYDWKTGQSYSVRPTHPDPNLKLRFNWNSAIAQDPFDNATLYFGSQFVHKSTDKGLSWQIISPDLTTNNPEKQNQTDSGGLTIDATGAENHCTILVIEPSPLTKDILWTGSDDGRVHITQDGGESWKDVSKGLKGLPEGSWIAQIRASDKNEGEALLIANDYRRFNYTPYAYRTKNYGKSWERIVDENDTKSFTLSIIEDPETPNLLFLGTDDGLYISVDAGNKWTKWTEGYPTVPTSDLAIHPREHDLVIGTFGRAAWVLDDIRPLREIAKNTNSLEKEMLLFNPPTAYQASYQQPTGTRFGGHSMYSGDNRQSGAMITYFLNKTSKESEKKETSENENNGEHAELAKTETSKDSVKLEVYDGDRLIRTLKHKTPKEKGIHRMYWYMDEKGPDYPSRTIRKNNRENGGISVKPGTYRLKMIYGDLTEETIIKVESDPRIIASPAGINERYTAYKTLESYQQTTADAVKQLVESKNTAQDYQTELQKLDKEKFKEEIDASKKITKKIDSVIAIYLGKIDKRQGLTRSTDPTVNSRISNARYYVSSRPEGITATEKRLISQAKEALQEALKTTNAFFKEEWPAYQEKMKALKITRFKETETFNINP